MWFTWLSGPPRTAATARWSDLTRLTNLSFRSYTAGGSGESAIALQSGKSVESPRPLRTHISGRTRPTRLTGVPDSTLEPWVADTATRWSSDSQSSVKSCLLQRLLHESDSWPEALYDLGTNSWLAWANDTAAQCAQLDPPFSMQRRRRFICQMNHISN